MATSVKLKIHEFIGEEMKEEFPTEEGKRCKLDIAITENSLNLNDKVDSVVLTLLKKDDANTSNTIYSLSIKLKKGFEIEKNSVTENIYGNEKFIYTTDTTDKTTNNISKLYDLQDKNTDITHILIIGNSYNVIDSAFDFTPSKSIFVTNIPITSAQSMKCFKESLKIQEFLNLLYIDYFSFDNVKFNELYNNNPAIAGGNSKKNKKIKK
jgi:hypothetical protein